MKLIALLCWYDERDEWLDKGIKSLAKAPVDHVIAVDGAYRLFPDGHPQSPPSNAETIQRACDDTGIGCTIHVPDHLWEGNEIEKRSFMFRMAEDHAVPNVDWLWVWDADEQLGRCRDLKPRLQATDLDAGDIRLIEPPDERDPGCRYLPNGLPEPVRTDLRMLFRHIPGTRVVKNHYTYMAPDGRCLWGNPNTDQLVPGLDLSDVQVLHKTNLRQDSRAARRIRLYAERDRTGAEDTTCHWCGREGYTQGIAHSWEWTRHDTGWLLSGGLAPACAECAPKHGTPRDRPMVLTCPQCNGTASRNNPCRFCGTSGYKLHDPNEIQMNLRPAITDDKREGIKAVTR